MSLQVNRVTNANLYVNGTSWFGAAAEVTVPQMKTKFSEHQTLGMFAMVELPSGLDKLEATFKWNSFYADKLGVTANPFATVDVQVRASVEVYNSAGRVEEQPAVIYLRGTFKDPDGGNFKQHDNVELSAKMNVTAMKMEINGVPVYEIDTLANIWKVNGVDILANYRQNLGL